MSLLKFVTNAGSFADKEDIIPSSIVLPSSIRGVPRVRTYFSRNSYGSDIFSGYEKEHYRLRIDWKDDTSVTDSLARDVLALLATEKRFFSPRSIGYRVTYTPDEFFALDHLSPSLSYLSLSARLNFKDPGIKRFVDDPNRDDISGISFKIDGHIGKIHLIDGRFAGRIPAFRKDFKPSSINLLISPEQHDRLRARGVNLRPYEVRNTLVGFAAALMKQLSAEESSFEVCIPPFLFQEVSSAVGGVFSSGIADFHNIPLLNMTKSYTYFRKQKRELYDAQAFLRWIQEKELGVLLDSNPVTLVDARRLLDEELSSVRVFLDNPDNKTSRWDINRPRELKLLKDHTCAFLDDGSLINDANDRKLMSFAQGLGYNGDEGYYELLDWIVQRGIASGNKDKLVQRVRDYYVVPPLDVSIIAWYDTKLYPWADVSPPQLGTMDAVNLSVEKNGSLAFITLDGMNRSSRTHLEVASCYDDLSQVALQEKVLDLLGVSFEG